MDSDGAAEAVVYVSDDYFPPDDSLTHQAAWRLGEITDASSADLDSAAGSSWATRWLSRLVRVVARREERHRTDASLLSSLLSGLTALEDYTVSDEAAQQLAKLSWLPVSSSAAQQQRRRGRQLMWCMRGQPQRLNASDAALETEMKRTVEEEKEESDVAGSRICGNSGLTPSPAGASTLVSANASDTAAVDAASVSCSSIPAFNESDGDAGKPTTADSSSRSTSSSGLHPLQEYPLLQSTFTNVSFGHSCWRALGETLVDYSGGSGGTLYAFMATLTFLQVHVQTWAHNWLLHNAHAVSEGNATAPPSVMGAHALSLSASRPTVSYLALASSARQAPLQLLRCCLYLLRNTFRMLSYLVFFFSASFQPAADSIMGALATNVMWRVQVELMLLMVAVVLLCLWGAVVMRYRKYTRTVELWESEGRRRDAAEAAEWLAEMERGAAAARRVASATRSHEDNSQTGGAGARRTGDTTAKATFVFPSKAAPMAGKEYAEPRCRQESPDALAHTQPAAKSEGSYLHPTGYARTGGFSKQALRSDGAQGALQPPRSLAVHSLVGESPILSPPDASLLHRGGGDDSGTLADCLRAAGNDPWEMRMPAPLPASMMATAGSERRSSAGMHSLEGSSSSEITRANNVTIAYADLSHR